MRQTGLSLTCMGKSFRCNQELSNSGLRFNYRIGHICWDTQGVGGGMKVLPCISYIGMCGAKGYGF